jgi:RNA-binding protein YhbY
MNGWIGCDLDGTLAEYNGWQGPQHIGAPIPKMLERVKRWLSEGKDVRILTARASTEDKRELHIFLEALEAWLLEHVGQTLIIYVQERPRHDLPVRRSVPAGDY